MSNKWKIIIKMFWYFVSENIKKKLSTYLVSENIGECRISAENIENVY